MLNGVKWPGEALCCANDVEQAGMRKQDKIAVILMIAFGIVVFFGASRVMAPDRSPQSFAETSPAVEYEDYYADEAASQDNPDESESPALD